MLWMGHLGEGAIEAAARRKVWTAQEERSRKEGEAFHYAYMCKIDSKQEKRRRS